MDCLAANPVELLTHLRVVLTRFRRSRREIGGIVCTLAAGIGLATAAWTILEAVLIRPLPYADPAELAQVWDAEEPQGYRTLSERDFRLLQEASGAHRPMAAHAVLSVKVSLSSLGPEQTVGAALVTADMFKVLGVGAKRGRTFLPADERLGPVLPVVIGERLLKSTFDGAAIGDTIYVDGSARTLVGVMPKQFWFPDPETLVWLCSVNVEGGASWTRPILARAGVSTGGPAGLSDWSNTALANAERKTRVRAKPYVAVLTEEFREPLTILQAGAALVLLMVTINAGWMYLGRARRNLQQTSIMGALGATSGRILSIHGTEAAAIAALALPLALLLAWLALAWARAAGAAAVPRLTEASLTTTVFSVTALMALMASFSASIPATVLSVRAARALDIAPVSIADGDHWWNRGLMAVQASFVVTMAALAVLLLLTFRQLVGTNVGFGNTSVVGVRIEPKARGADIGEAGVTSLLDELRRRHTAAAVTNAPPLAGRDQFVTGFPGDLRAERTRMVAVRLVSPEFFRVVGLPIVRGRAFDTSDVSRPTIVDEDLARGFWGTADVLGRSIRLGSARWTIVGVVRPVGHGALLEDAPPAAYVPYGADAVQHVSSGPDKLFLLADASRGTAGTLEVLTTLIARELPEATVAETWSFRDLITRASGARPLLTGATTLFALVAALLTAAGIYGMMSATITRQSREIGVRMALGASSARIVQERARSVATMYCAAAILAVGQCAVLGMVVDKVLFIPQTLPSPDLRTVLGAALGILALVFIAASYVPLRRATRLDASVLLREQ